MHSSPHRPDLHNHEHVSIQLPLTVEVKLSSMYTFSKIVSPISSDSFRMVLSSGANGLKILYYFFLISCSIFVTTRIFIRGRKTRNFGADDCFLLATLVHSPIPPPTRSKLTY